jgi:hypothetical protein
LEGEKKAARIFTGLQAIVTCMALTPK